MTITVVTHDQNGERIDEYDIDTFMNKVKPVVEQIWFNTNILDYTVECFITLPETKV